MKWGSHKSVLASVLGLSALLPSAVLAQESAAPDGSGADGLDLLAADAGQEEQVAAAAKPEEPATAAAATEPASPADDQDADKDTRKAPRSRLLEEIVVTAQKREQDLQDVPTSVQAFSAGQLEAQGVDDLSDLQMVTPGLTFDSMASYSIIFIRGIGGDAFQAGIDSSVATYIDGLYLPFTFSSAQALGDVKQVEVLKGPQGTLYGRNAIAGAIKVELKKPTDEYALDVLQQFGNYDDRKTKLSFSGPVPFTDDTLKFGVSGLYQKHDAHTEYAFDSSKKYRAYENRGFRGVLLWEPNESFDIQATHYDLSNKDADSVITVLLKASPAFTGPLTAIDEPHKSGNQNNVGVDAKTKISTVTANARWFDAFDMKMVYGKISAESTILFDYDSAPEPVLDISAIPNTADSDIAELIFSSNASAMPDWLEWIGGLYYEDTLKTGRYPIKIEPVALALGVPGAAQSTGNGPLQFLSFFQGGRGAVCDVYTAVGGDCDSNSATNQNILLEVPLTSGVTTDALSAYGQLTFHLNQDWSVVAGGRVSTETRKLVYSTVDSRFIIPQGGGLGNLVIGGDAISQVVPGITTQTFSPISFRPQEHTWRSFTPNFGLNFNASEETLYYYRYAEAFKSGNFNGLNITNPPTRIEPELATTHEFGVKTALFDSSVKLNAALFSTRVSNAQVQNLSLASGGVTSLQNAAVYTVKGMEVEASWYPTESLVFNLSAVYLDGEYGEFTGRAFRPETGLIDENIDFSGNDTVRTPKYSGTFAVNYTFPFFFDLEAEVGGDIYYNDGFYYDPLNTLTQEAYNIVGARFSLLHPDSNLRVTVYGNNLTDDVYFTQKYRQDFGDTGFYGAARTFGVFFTWSL